jgi:prepilin-type N-terminal cleavage/methylation domain-containing protein
MRLKHCFRNQRGDTIVEVLIAIAVISLVLAGAYATVRKSTATMQDTQERGEAQKLVEGQLELMRHYYAAKSASFPASGDWCLGQDGSINAGNAFNNVCISTDPAAYKTTIKPAGAGTYAVSATWDSLTGNTSNVTMYYRPE